MSRAYAPAMSEIRLVPASNGRFEVSLDGELLFSKAALGRHAHEGEVLSLIAVQLGEAIPR